MPNKKIKISIFTPEKKIYEDEVDFISIPAASGSMGILPDHIPIVVQLGVGIVKLVSGSKSKYIGICRGYLEFITNSANILTERAIVTSYNQIKETTEELKKKHNIIQEITDETKSIIQAIASMSKLKK